ncbi:hypothetical protein [Pseudomonas chlororaphis]|nr:hypothetical protein [Pseudomonas chlororaphis]MBP5060408.1 hypothetical protein [Pseudomonas chlororaphis]MBP5142422.1 hypothetical protein [Pseudomonas chlororaphis]MBP5144220.1 hypothetical protein [Pseudomonas chlororaphis]
MSTNNQITLSIDDYLSEAEKKQIVADAFRAEAARHSQEDFERIISNSAYHLVSEAVDTHFDGGMVEVLTANAIKVINNLSSTTVFSPPNAWDRAASKGFEHLQAALDDLKPLIRGRVSELIASYDSAHMSEMIERQVGEAIIRKLTA